jgi:hypothetical protein
MKNAIIITHDKKTYKSLKALLKIIFPEVDVSFVLNNDPTSEEDLMDQCLNGSTVLRGKN